MTITLNRLGSATNDRVFGELPAASPSEMITRSRSHPWKPWTRPDPQVELVDLLERELLDDRRLDRVGLAAERRQHADARGRSAAAHRRLPFAHDRDRAIDLRTVHAPGAFAPTLSTVMQSRSWFRGCVVAIVTLAVVEPTRRERDQVWRAAEVLVEHAHGALRSQRGRTGSSAARRAALRRSRR